MKHLSLFASLSIGCQFLGGVCSNAAVNLIPNGDFELGVSGFASDYLLASGLPGSLVPEDTFYVGPDPFLYHPSFTSFGDHTTGHGKMLIANGSADITDDVWETTAAIPVTPDTLYYFEAWIASVYPVSPALLSFELDGNISDAVVGIGSPGSTTGVWDFRSFTWDSGPNTSVILSLRNANSAHDGNDFAVDDIFLGVETSEEGVVPEPATVWSAILLGGLVFRGALRRRK